MTQQRKRIKEKLETKGGLWRFFKIQPHREKMNIRIKTKYLMTVHSQL